MLEIDWSIQKYNNVQGVPFQISKFNITGSVITLKIGHADFTRLSTFFIVGY